MLDGTLTAIRIGRWFRRRPPNVSLQNWTWTWCIAPRLLIQENSKSLFENPFLFLQCSDTYLTIFVAGEFGRFAGLYM